jgi:uncharacterized protein YegL
VYQTKLKEKGIMKPTEIIFVLDRSGSMSSVLESTIQGFNTFLAEQKKIDQPCNFTLIQFDDQYEVVINNQVLKYVPELNTNTFVPRGGTALYDAVGKAINSRKDTTNNVIFVILTDGHENVSREFDQRKISALITEQRARGWNFTFLGANQDAMLSARALSIDANAVMNYAANSVGVSNTFKSVSRALHTNRVSGQSINYSAADRSAAMGGPEDFSGTDENSHLMSSNQGLNK